MDRPAAGFHDWGLEIVVAVVAEECAASAEQYVVAAAAVGKPWIEQRGAERVAAVAAAVGVEQEQVAAAVDDGKGPVAELSCQWVVVVAVVGGSVAGVVVAAAAALVTVVWVAQVVAVAAAVHAVALHGVFSPFCCGLERHH